MDQFNNDFEDFVWEAAEADKQIWSSEKIISNKITKAETNNQCSK